VRCGDVRQDGVCARHREQLDQMFNDERVTVPSNEKKGIIVNIYVKDIEKNYKLKSSKAYYKILNSIDMNGERCNYNSQIHDKMNLFCKMSNPFLWFDIDNENVNATNKKEGGVNCAQQ
jgi:hypothetical protein